MISFINKLKKVQPGDLISDTVTAARLNAIQDAIKALARCENLHIGDGLLLRRGSGGATLQTNLQPDNSEIAADTVFCFLPYNSELALRSIGDVGGGLRTYGGDAAQGIVIPWSNENANLAEPKLDPKNLVPETRCLWVRGRRGLKKPKGVTDYFHFAVPGTYEIQVDTICMVIQDDDDPRANYQNMTVATWANIGGYGSVSQCRANVPPQSISWETLTPSNRIPSDHLAHINTIFYEHNTVPHCINNEALIQPYFCGPRTIDGYERNPEYGEWHYVPSKDAVYTNNGCSQTTYCDEEDKVDINISIPTFEIPVTVTDSCGDYYGKECCCEVSIDPVTISDFTIAIPPPYSDCPPPEIPEADGCEALPTKIELQDPGVITCRGTTRFIVEVTPIPGVHRTGDYWEWYDPTNQLFIRYEKDGAVKRDLPNTIDFWSQTAHQEWQSVEHPTEDPRWVKKNPVMIDLRIQCTRVGHIEDITHIDRPANLPGDLLEKRAKDPEYGTS